MDEEFELELLEELFDELLDELEFELDELLEDEFEFELLDEFELEFDEPFELELLDEFEELLPATMIDPSLLVLLAAGRSMPVVAGYSLASTAVVAKAATPATTADFSFQYRVMAVTPLMVDRFCDPAE